MKHLGLILAPEIVTWTTPVSLGSPSPIQMLQNRICFTELSSRELGEHAGRFGPFALEFDIMALRRAGALPVIYMPQALSEQDILALLGPFTAAHLKHIRYTLTQLSTLDRFRDPEYVQQKYPGALRVEDDCVFTLRNGDESRGTLQEFQVPWSALRDILCFIGFENAPFDAMLGAISVAQSLFYPTDDAHNDVLLGYYRQHEWRITADYFVNGNPRGRNLEEGEKKILTDLDSSFWERVLNFEHETFRRVDKAVSLAQPDSDSLLEMAACLIVPSEIIDEARQLFGELGVEVRTLYSC